MITSTVECSAVIKDFIGVPKHSLMKILEASYDGWPIEKSGRSGNSFATERTVGF
jgi:hypothetical protein